jgi:hypothetical protein
MQRILFSFLSVMVLVLLCAGASLAQERDAASLPDKPAVVPDRSVPISVLHSGDDSIGAKLTAELKDAFNVNSLFKLTENDESKLRVLLKTTPEFPTRPAVGSTYSLVWVFARNADSLEHFLVHETGVVSLDDISGLVAHILERTDGLSVKYAYLFK